MTTYEKIKAVLRANRGKGVTIAFYIEEGKGDDKLLCQTSRFDIKEEEGNRVFVGFYTKAKGFFTERLNDLF